MGQKRGILVRKRIVLSSRALIVSVEVPVIYLDANATSRIRPVAARALAELSAESSLVRNPSSIHAMGRLARARLTEARRQLAELLLRGSVAKVRTVFTSGATEACNQMIWGFLAPLGELGRFPAHIVSSAIEHPAIDEPLRALEAWGWEVTRVVPRESGILDAADIAAAVTPKTALVAVMAANNETGAVQPLLTIATLLREKKYQGAIVSDYTQVFGKLAIDAKSLFDAGVDALAVSGHKLGAPAGIGALFLAEGADRICRTVHPLIVGGAQEQRFRGGSENLFGAVAFGAVAAELSQSVADDERERRKLREQLWLRLERSVPQLERLTPSDEGECRSLPNTLLVRVEGCRGDDVVVALDLEGVAASVGSACSSGKQGASEAVKAMGLSDTAAREIVRLSLDWDATEDTVIRASEIVTRVVERMRKATQVSEQWTHR